MHVLGAGQQVVKKVPQRFSECVGNESEVRVLCILKDIPEAIRDILQGRFSERTGELNADVVDVHEPHVDDNNAPGHLGHSPVAPFRPHLCRPFFEFPSGANF